MINRQCIMEPFSSKNSARPAAGPDLSPSRIAVRIEVPKGGFLKRKSDGRVDFVSPFPCPFNYGSVDGWEGADRDLLDAVVLGHRLTRGARVTVAVRDAVGFRDRGMRDDKLICSHRRIGPTTRQTILRFFLFYARCKRILDRRRGYRGPPTVCEGWIGAEKAFAGARIKKAESCCRSRSVR